MSTLKDAVFAAAAGGTVIGVKNALQGGNLKTIAKQGGKGAILGASIFLVYKGLKSLCN